jgi:hypothetical protein
MRKRDALGKTTGNFTLISAPRTFRRGRRRIVNTKEKVYNTLDLEGNICCTNLQKEVPLVGFNHKEEKE